MPSPAIIPVLDLMGGVVVRGVAGERHRYQPIQSQLTASPDPLAVARAIETRYGLKEFYVADLDAIMRGELQVDVLRSLIQNGFELNVDAGVTDADAAEYLLNLGVCRVIIGLETLRDLDDLGTLIETFGPEAILFSIDLKHGTPLGQVGDGKSPMQIAWAAATQGIQRFIILDLAAVGIGEGIPTLPLCDSIRSELPEAILWTGGGVRSSQDIDHAGNHRLDGILVASALHDGRL